MFNKIKSWFKREERNYPETPAQTYQLLMDQMKNDYGLSEPNIEVHFHMNYYDSEEEEIKNAIRLLRDINAEDDSFELKMDEDTIRASRDMFNEFLVFLENPDQYIDLTLKEEE
ncbi:MAG: hypothetical protein ACOCRO_10820 [Halanaerobiales bacterium]